MTFQVASLAARSRKILLRTTPRRRDFATSQSKNRVTVALYRQLLRWCHDTDEDIPLSQFIPPIHLQSPQIDETVLKDMVKQQEEGQFKDTTTLSMLPSKTIIDATKLTCPVENSTDIRDFFRAIFRINSTHPPSDAEIQKQRISVAFEALKSLNELTEALDDMKSHRKEHQNREGVLFKVGQVVRHKREDWRGVVVGWERLLGSPNDAKPSSLTNKTYELKEEDRIRYSILLDSGDAHLHYTKRREPGDLSSAQVHQSDLVPMEDEKLFCRVRSSYISQHFSRFNPSEKQFVPNAVKLYEYPDDFDSSNEETELGSSESDKAAQEVIDGIQELALHLKDIILGGRSTAPELQHLKLLSFILRRVEEMSNGDVVTIKEKFNSNAEILPQKLATFHLRALLNLTVEIGELLWQRRTTLESNAKTKFNIGDIVEHKVFSFRGVIIGWDSRPSVDVSRWDGLQHIDNPQNYPFYHVIPDQNDCIEAFGGERPSRYVCEENLTSCPVDRRRIHVDLQSPEWEFDSHSLSYKAPEDLKFKYGQDLGDDDLTSQTLEELRGNLARVLTSARDNHSTGIHSLDQTAQQLSMDNLLKLLKSADSMDDSTTISECIKEIWKSHRSNDVRWRFDTAVGKMLNGDTDSALSIFGELVEEDPSYAEAWNKASTCEFMNGNMEGAIVSAQKALELTPTHYQALNGLGLIRFENKDLAGAIELFERSMEIDPWSPVAARLLSCKDALASRRGGATMGENQEWKAP